MSTAFVESIILISTLLSV